MGSIEYKIILIYECLVWMFLPTFCIVKATECGGNLTGNYGTLSSKYFPLAYPKNQDCLWTIFSPEGTTMSVKILNIGLDENCTNEFVELADNGNVTKACHTQLPELFKTSDNMVNVHFVSDNMTSNRFNIGFKLEWEVNNVYTFHTGRQTWMEAQNICSLNGGSLLYKYKPTEIAHLAVDADSDKVWQGKYFTKWVWLKGCYGLDGNEFGTSINIKTNQMKECLDSCQDSNYFGLQFEKCFCFDTFIGPQLTPATNCTKHCPGNYKETCGGPDALTVYMNDICYNHSTHWSGNIARTYSGNPCIPWKHDLDYTDEFVHNDSNYCRDPDSSSYLWCYINETVHEQCDIPQCIAKDDYIRSSCMVFNISSSFKVFYQQVPCNTANIAGCVTKDGTLSSGRTLDWENARMECRGHSNTQFDGMLGSSIFRHKRKIEKFHWIGYYRSMTNTYDLLPIHQPRQCLTLFKTNSKITLNETVTDCSEKHPFICQQVPITCGENLKDLNGGIYSPGYPFKYDAYLHCVWNLVVAMNNRLSLSYDVDIEDSILCRRDSVQIIDNISGEVLKLCGQKKGTYRTTGNQVTIIFQSDKTVQETTGFYITWDTVRTPEEHSSVDDTGGTSGGVNSTALIGTLSVIGLIVLISSYIYYRQRRQTNFKSEHIPKLSRPLTFNDDTDHISDVSFVVSDDELSEQEDEVNYSNLTFRRDESAEHKKVTECNNIMYDMPCHQNNADDEGTRTDAVNGIYMKDLDKDDIPEIAGEQESDNVKDNGGEIATSCVKLHRNKIIYSYARELCFEAGMETVKSDMNDGVYEKYDQHEGGKETVHADINYGVKEACDLNGADVETV